METPDFGALYQRYARDVLRFALYLTGSHADAEDIVSETFVRAWVGANELCVGTLKAYLFTIARNLHLDGRRRRRARGAELSSELPDPAPDPHASLAARGELEAVLADLQRLPEIDRAALLMRAVDELPYENIAAALGISVAAARVKVHRARLWLSDLRKDEGRR